MRLSRAAARLTSQTTEPFLTRTFWFLLSADGQVEQSLNKALTKELLLTLRKELKKIQKNKQVNTHTQSQKKRHKTLVKRSRAKTTTQSQKKLSTERKVEYVSGPSKIHDELERSDRPCATEKQGHAHCAVVSLRRKKKEIGRIKKEQRERKDERIFCYSLSLVSLGLIKEIRKEWRNSNVQCFASAT